MAFLPSGFAADHRPIHILYLMYKNAIGRRPPPGKAEKRGTTPAHFARGHRIGQCRRSRHRVRSHRAGRGRKPHDVVPLVVGSAGTTDRRPSRSISDSVEATADDPIAALRTQVMETVAILVNPPTAGPLRALAARALADPAAHTMFVEHWLRPRRRFIRDLVGNAARRGLLMPSAGDVDEVVDILFGPLYYRAFFTGETLDEGFVERLLIAAGVTPAEPDGDLIDLGR